MEDGRGPRRIEEFPAMPQGVVPAPQEFVEFATAADGGFIPGGEVR
jgi:hypothetical protein